MLIIANNPPSYKKKPGRPRKTDYLGLSKDDLKAFETVREKWNYASLYLADEVAKAAKAGDKKFLSVLTTSAGIAYDKAFGKREAETGQVNIPPTLARSILKALKVKDTTPNSTPDLTTTIDSGTRNSVTEIPHTIPGGDGLRCSEIAGDGDSTHEQSDNSQIESTSVE